MHSLIAQTFEGHSIAPLISGAVTATVMLAHQAGIKELAPIKAVLSPCV